MKTRIGLLAIVAWVALLGPGGCGGGGTIVCTGTPEDIADPTASHTGQFLKPVLEKHRA